MTSYFKIHPELNYRTAVQTSSLIMHFHKNLCFKSKEGSLWDHKKAYYYKVMWVMIRKNNSKFEVSNLIMKKIKWKYVTVKVRHSVFICLFNLTSGIHTGALNVCLNSFTFLSLVFALLKSNMIFLIFLLCRIGTSDINSTPPATTASHWPAAISPMAVMWKIDVKYTGI